MTTNEAKQTKWTYKGWPGCNNLIEASDDYPYAAKIGIAGSSGNSAIAVAYGESNDAVDANARLIAAAPELLHALKCLRGWMLEPWGADDGPENEAVIYMAEAAIALAQGGAP